MGQNRTCSKLPRRFSLTLQLHNLLPQCLGLRFPIRHDNFFHRVNLLCFEGAPYVFQPRPTVSNIEKPNLGPLDTLGSAWEAPLGTFDELCCLLFLFGHRWYGDLQLSLLKRSLQCSFLGEILCSQFGQSNLQPRDLGGGSCPAFLPATSVDGAYLTDQQTEVLASNALGALKHLRDVPKSGHFWVTGQGPWMICTHPSGAAIQPETTTTFCRNAKGKLKHVDAREQRRLEQKQLEPKWWRTS